MILQTETLHNINWKIWYPYERLPIGSGAFWENHCVRPAWAICPPEGRQVFFTFRKEERAKRERYIKKFWTCWSFLQSLFCWSQPPGRPTQSERKNQLKRSNSDPAGNFWIGTNKSRPPWSICVYKYIRASGLWHQKIICQRWSAGLVCPAIGLPWGVDTLGRSPPPVHRWVFDTRFVKYGLQWDVDMLGGSMFRTTVMIKITGLAWELFRQ